jgi:hypothetical protein
LRFVCAVVSEQLKRSRVRNRRSLMERTFSFRHAVKKPAQVWLAKQLLAWNDAPRALEDLGVKKAAKALLKDGAKVFAWYTQNRDYVYWQPYERRFRLDTKAREAKTPTEAFRKKTPWGKDEGPLRKVKRPGR